MGLEQHEAIEYMGKARKHIDDTLDLKQAKVHAEQLIRYMESEANRRDRVKEYKARQKEQEAEEAKRRQASQLHEYKKQEERERQAKALEAKKEALFLAAELAKKEEAAAVKKWTPPVSTSDIVGA
jgi:hypothetical protein